MNINHQSVVRVGNDEVTLTQFLAVNPELAYTDVVDDLSKQGYHDVDTGNCTTERVTLVVMSKYEPFWVCHIAQQHGDPC